MLYADQLEDLGVEVYQIPDLGLVVAFLGEPGDQHGWLAEGRAVCHPDDLFDPEIGVQLALGRAFENLGRKYQKRANGLVKHHEDNEAHRAQIAPRKELWPVAREAFYRSVQAKR